MLRAMESETGKALRAVLERVASAYLARPANLQRIRPRLVAVSKTKPISLINEAYVNGQRHFGENYVQEIEEKGHSPEVLEKMNDIRWHFIGHLQRKKIPKLLGVPNLYMVETIDSEKLATAVNNSWSKLPRPHRLKMMIQVNTSGEQNKHGCKPEEVTSLVSFVLQCCPHLELMGLMTIGAFDHDLSKGPNPDFQLLIKCKQAVCENLDLDPDLLELSMGMSNDFEHAIAMGSTNVRVGSTIFGARTYKPKSVSPTPGMAANETETNTSADCGISGNKQQSKAAAAATDEAAAAATDEAAAAATDEAAAAATDEAADVKGLTDQIGNTSVKESS